MDLSEKLKFLTGNRSELDTTDDLTGNDSPHDDEKNDGIQINANPLSIDHYLNSNGRNFKKSDKKNKRKQDSFSIIMDDSDDVLDTSTKSSDAEKITKMTDRLLSDATLMDVYEFDSYLDDTETLGLEEDIDMKNHLISMGRKYARESATSKENSEITKAFADSDKRLKELYNEVDKDKNAIQKDIDRMRVPGRGGKSLSDLISVKKGMHDTQLSIIKEINQMKKSMYELKAKEAARKAAENTGGNDISPNTLQSIFSSAKSKLISSIGGYQEVSGAGIESDDDSYSFVTDDMNDDEIQRKYFANDAQDSDGDKFLQYEDRGVEYVVVMDSDDNVSEIYAEDRDGIRIPDYPLPNNIEDLKFEIDPIAHTAVDSMHRNYKLKRE